MVGVIYYCLEEVFILHKTFSKTQELAVTGNYTSNYPGNYNSIYPGSYNIEIEPYQLLALVRNKWRSLQLTYYNALMIGCMDKTMKNHLTARIDVLKRSVKGSCLN